MGYSLFSRFGIGRGEIPKQDEIELKLAVSRQDADRLARSPFLRAISARRARTLSLANAYFDTPDGDLGRNQMSLRIRTVGRRRIQTLKTPANKTAGMQHYVEFESDVVDEKPDIEKIDDAKLRRYLRKLNETKGLQQRFSTRFTRNSRIVRYDGSDIEVCVDQGAIEAGERRQPISEVELELIAGRPERLPKLALELNKRFPLRTEVRSKAFRANALLAGQRPLPLKAGKVALSYDQSLEEAFQSVVRSCLEQIRGNEAAVLDGTDPEGVHQMRIGLRRLLTVLKVFRPVLKARRYSYLKTTAKWAQGQLGPARDWDVFRGSTLPMMRDHTDRADMIDWLDAKSRRMLENAYKQAHTLVADPRYSALVLQLTLWLNTGGFVVGKKTPGRRKGGQKGELRRLAGDILSARDRKMRKLASNTKGLSHRQLHRLRLRAKQMRYQAEYFQSLFGKKEARRFIATVVDIQDCLGSLNDAVVAEHLMDDLAALATGRGDKPMLAAARTALASHMESRIAGDLEQFSAVNCQYLEADRFWS